MTRPYRNLRELHPELFQLWYQIIDKAPSAKEPLILQLSNRKDAIQTRKRLYYARTRLIDENAERCTQMVSYEIRLIPPALLEISRPAWVDVVRDVLGPDAPEVPPPPPPEIPQETAMAIKALFGPEATRGKESN